ncbi:heat shock factor protein 1 isoform X2 [Lampris incognitus]|nr:heat shock factor protein 1 isoform X2 [Lampris incognitus]XP_056153791.1 heat shock factor protein 1 isoform X2 [Lampris incognitus]
MASFIRQLNMYGFRKVVHIEHGGLVKPEKDDTEFQHPFFIRGQEHLLENIKRKVTTVSAVKQEELKMSPEEVSKLLSDVQIMKGKQETMDSKITAMKHENEALWREVASLRQKHAQQQKVVNKLIQFLVSLVQSNRVLGMKRKIPLMLNDSSSAHSMPKYSRQFSLEPLQASPAIPASAGLSPASLYPADSPLKSGPIISDVTDLATCSSIEISSDWTDAGESPVVHVKEEPNSPEVEEMCPVLEGGLTPVDTPLSPTTFFNSILQENEAVPNHNPFAANPISVSPVISRGSTNIGPLPTITTNQLNPSAPAPHFSPSAAKADQTCLSVACIDKAKLTDHLDNIDNGLENLQNLLNAQAISFDSSPLFEFFSTSVPSGDLDLDNLDTLLSPEIPKATESINNCTNAGKQLVQYMATPVLMTEPISSGEGEADLPTLLELEGDSYFNTDPPPNEDLTTSLLMTPDPPTATAQQAKLI